MASLDRMGFRGVRSFSDKDINIVRFHTPLTVIQGANGSGKTTIIECLKYATTGDMPPNSKGGAFIHDPGMATANEVKAQVRLRFYNTNRVAINAIRNVQVTRKRTGGLTMKTLESLLNVDDANGKSSKRTTISTKCADMDQEIPALLGVSRAILDNVIFCHQEENNWPLGEPSALKKKFDEIFESSRYQKAVDSLKSTRKELTENNRVAQAELEGLKKDRERADNVKAKLNTLTEDLRERERRLKWLNDELTELTQHNRELHDKATSFREKVTVVEGLEERKVMLNDNIAALKGSMTVLTDPEDELIRRKDGFQAHLVELKRKQDTSKTRVAELKKEYKETEAQYNRKLSERGALESDRKYHERAVEQRKEIISMVSSKLGVKGYDSAVSEEKIDEFMDRIDDELRKARKELDTMKARYTARENEAATKHQDLRTNFRAKEASKEALLESTKRLKDRAKKVQEDIDAAIVTDADIEIARKEHSDAEKQLQVLNDELSAAKYEDKIRERNTHIRDLEDRREEMTSELNTLNRQAEFRARLDLSRKTAREKEDEAQKILERYAQGFETLLGHVAAPETVEDEVFDVSSTVEKELAEREQADMDINNRIQRLTSALKMSQDQHSQKESIAGDLSTKIQTALTEAEATSVDEAIASCRKEVEYIKDSMSMSGAMTDFFERAQKHSANTHKCLGCDRKIEASEVSGVDAYLLDKIRKSKPARQEELRADLSGWQEELEKFNNLKTAQVQLDDLREKDLLNLTREIASVKAQLKAAQEEAERSASVVTQSRDKMRELAVLKMAANDVTRLNVDGKQLDKTAASIENDLRSTGSIRTGDEVQSEIDALADQIKKAKRDINGLQADKDAKRTAIASQERRMHQTEMAVAQKAQDHQNLLALQHRADEIRDESSESNAKLVRLQKDLKDSEDPIQRAGSELDRIKREAAREVAQEQEKVSDMAAHYKKLEESKTAVDNYMNQRGPQKLKDCESMIKDLEQRMAAVQRDIDEHGSGIASMERDLTESRSTERNIADNLRYLQFQRDIKGIDDQINALDLNDALKSFREWEDKYNISKRKENKLNGDASHISGEIASLKSQIKGRERELSDDYKGVEKNYLKKLIDVQTSKLAQQDLETYQKALQAAIMKFHSIKMEEINERLGELWRETYQGSDVDCVMIRADDEGAGARSHNYRVVMVKDSVELDMRGRCSAGQKCLASILIRLALADSFSENCGIMALDEPTTNLDYDNILSLAQSLAQLVQQRRQQSNFQLIVITHDDEFLDKLTRSVGLDEWLRVTRDDRNRSVIHRERHVL